MKLQEAIARQLAVNSSHIKWDNMIEPHRYMFMRQAQEMLDLFGRFLMHNNTTDDFAPKAILCIEEDHMP